MKKFMPSLKWLYPGMQVKRWTGLALIGMALLLPLSGAARAVPAKAGGSGCGFGKSMRSLSHWHERSISSTKYGQQATS